MLFRWKSEALRNYQRGDIVVSASTVLEARILARALFPAVVEERWSYLLDLDEKEELEIKLAELEADIAKEPEQMAVHPVVRIHPETGRKALFVNEHFTRRIVELSHQESEALLPFLTRWVASPRFTIRYHWTPGTIAMWDNRCVWHFALNDYHGQRRHMRRVTVNGDKVR